ncbi:DNA topoisomerase III [Apostasia shenzhenica]|uniref:DNA topoisomerase III n=1 Tax=Apostasia shenzhenica TaxID=1088818 RepID=A0A2I0A9N6_9ASPA|nr:DNA topoisomerase III [Apostasia shenzhenica]
MIFSGYPRIESTAYPALFDFRTVLGAQQSNLLWGSLVKLLLTIAHGFHKPQIGSYAANDPPITPLTAANEVPLTLKNSPQWRPHCFHIQ